MRLIRNSVRAWAELVRLANLPTVPGDPLAGFLLAGGWGVLARQAAAPALAALLLYAAGMALNDAADIEEDRRTRPERPLPSGRISRRAAQIAGWALLCCGVACAFAAGWVAGCFGLALAAAILAYDLATKHFPWIGPFNMGLCRALSLLMGAAAACGSFILPWTSLLAAVGLGAYVMAVTRLARRETESGRLGGGRWAPMGIQALALVAVGGEALSGFTLPLRTVVSIGALAFLSVCHAGLVGWSLRGVQEPRGIQRGIGGFIHGLLFLQAAMAAIGALRPDVAAVGALVLILGSRWLSRWFQSS
jgi:4-hydroxybenzoate polyprenyltransferase